MSIDKWQAKDSKTATAPSIGLPIHAQNRSNFQRQFLPKDHPNEHHQQSSQRKPNQFIGKNDPKPKQLALDHFLAISN
nr:hypothetical protein [Ligilactobacillus salitolerans]